MEEAASNGLAIVAVFTVLPFVGVAFFGETVGRRYATDAPVWLPLVGLLLVVVVSWLYVVAFGVGAISAVLHALTSEPSSLGRLLAIGWVLRVLLVLTTGLFIMFGYKRARRLV